MSELRVIEAVKSGDTPGLKSLLAAGRGANEQDEHGWTPINWAAGRGDLESIGLLLEHDADLALTGRDGRTPLMIAKAADRQEAVAVLAAAEKARGLWKDERETRPYCRAYYLRDLRRFPGWQESRLNWREEVDGQAGEAEAPGLSDDDVVYLHQDFTVTRSMWHGESIVFPRVTPEWREFCAAELGFAVPGSLL
jgi:hypothetical protein